MENIPEVHIFADGACSGNPGPGGWGAILKYPAKKKEKRLSGAEADTTNNRMELTAVIQALSCLKIPCSIVITTDSRYVIDAFKAGWIKNWLKNGWKTASKQPVKNDDLWKQLIRLVEPHSVTWQWIRGHNGHPENEEADRLAVEARKNINDKTT